MPPPARVCVACKTSKTRCVNFAPGHRCDRCERLGLRCTLAPQRSQAAARKALGPAVRLLLEDEAGGAEQRAILAVDQAAIAWLPPAACCSQGIFKTLQAALFGSPRSDEEVRWLLRCMLREWMSIARRRNAYGLMIQTIGLSRQLGLRIDEIDDGGGGAGRAALPLLALTPNVTLPDGPAVPEGPAVPDGPAVPAQIASIVATCAGLCLARVVEDGAITFSASRAFEARVRTLAEVGRCWEANHSPVLALFVHEDDLGSLAALHGQLWAAVRANDALSMDTAAAAVRVLIDGVHVPCRVSAALLIEADGRRVSVATTFEPVDAPPGLGEPSLLAELCDEITREAGIGAELCAGLCGLAEHDGAGDVELHSLAELEALLGAEQPVPQP